jgi:3-methyl-2-oxobutanoate hydroxymethyltransferase
MKQKMQLERVSGFKEFIDDVQQGRFPGSEHIIKTSDNLISKFLEVVDAENDQL